MKQIEGNQLRVQRTVKFAVVKRVTRVRLKKGDQKRVEEKKREYMMLILEGREIPGCISKSNIIFSASRPGTGPVGFVRRNASQECSLRVCR